LPIVIEASRAFLALIAIGLGLVAVSIVLPLTIKIPVEYLATYSLIGAWAVGKAGIWDGQAGWRIAACKRAASWIGGLSFVALLGGVILIWTYRLDSTVVAAVNWLLQATLLSAIVLAAILFYGAGFRPRRRRRSRRSTRRH
jgi:hypothetical protein